MMKHRKPFKSDEVSAVEVSYYTPDLPPPYCYNYLLTANIKEDGLKIDFNLAYIEREDLEDEEILAEGFSLSDDFSYSGVLPLVWKNEVLAQLDRTSFLKGNPDEYPIHLKLEHKNTGESFEGYPSDLENWEYFLHELVQGIFEAGRKERQLEIIFRHVSNKSQMEEVVIGASFLSRTASRSMIVNGKRDEHQITFKDLKKILKAIYMPDFLPEKAHKKFPEKPGTYLNPGDGLWYEFGKSLLNPDPQFDSLKKAESLIRGER